ncbi:DUF190 domain-containing protein [Maridesulfovibrio hydrothermalis]|uniref:Uncharacterized protein n=1 Tax=Maridesulfovibrio hydrothermalis AM13 = DSM 14728 TaxID=1121451 RepID=L0RE97_9BACT|nr:DUF190 domain-containing protein [Maridesulfovibrio hydrothermalis]CCO24505.1 conserved protein of unknown function [Maridesulfovibrio hydrothermalis AM13 = DSM 14728]
MTLPEKAVRLKIYTGEENRIKHRPLFEVIVEEARKQGLAGASVYRGVMGYGVNSQVRTTSILRLSEDLPLIIEIVDTSDKIETFVNFLNEHMTEGLVTTDEVNIILHKHREGKKK